MAENIFFDAFQLFCTSKIGEIRFVSLFTMQTFP